MASLTSNAHSSTCIAGNTNVFQDAIDTHDTHRIIQLLIEGRSSPDIMNNGINAIFRLCYQKNERAAEHRITFEKLGAIQYILSGLTEFGKSYPELAFNCCSALWQLAMDRNNRISIGSEGGIEIVLKMLQVYSTGKDENHGIILNGCNALSVLSIENPSNKTKIGTCGGISLIFDFLMKCTFKSFRNIKVALAGINVLMILNEKSDKSDHSWWANQTITRTYGSRSKDIMLLLERFKLKWPDSLLIQKWSNKILTSLFSDDWRNARNNLKATIKIIKQARKDVNKKGIKKDENCKLRDCQTIAELMPLGLLASQTEDGRGMNSAELIFQGCRSVIKLCASVSDDPEKEKNNASHRRLFGENGTIHCIQGGMMNYGCVHTGVAEKSLWALRNLAIDPDNRKVIEEGGVGMIVLLLDEYGFGPDREKNVKVVRNGCAVLWYLFKNNSGVQKYVRGIDEGFGTSSILLHLKTVWADDVQVQKNIDGALRCFKKDDEFNTCTTRS